MDSTRPEGVLVSRQISAMRLLPSWRSRVRWMTASKAAASWLWTASLVRPAAQPRASRRGGTSAAVLAWRVPQPPSWPVLSAARRSTTSEPRTSPTTRRSGRILSACRTRSRRPTSPAPSRLGGRVSRRTTWGWRGRSSAESSTRRRRSPRSARESRAERRVVLPVPVPPVTRKASLAVTMAVRIGMAGGVMVPAWTRSDRVKVRRGGRRKLMQVPPGATGGSTAWRRTPPGRRASTYGEASSRRLPAAVARRWARRRTAPSSANVMAVRCRPAPSSIQTSRGPLTRTSVTSGRASSGSRGPAPMRSAHRARATARISASP